MSTTAEIIGATFAALALVTALTACTPTAEPAPTPTATDPANAMGRVVQPTWGEDKDVVACQTSEPRYDRGPLPSANGTVLEEDANGLAVSYELAPGDTFEGVSKRFCVELTTVNELNDHQRTIYAGEAIALR